MSNKLTNNKYWNSQYKNSINKKYTVNEKMNLSTTELTEVFKKMLPRNKRFKFIEIGCAPGMWMHYFYKEFGYQAEGIEYAEKGVELTKKNLNNLKVPYKLFHQDFLKNDLVKNNYDVVASFGFIEHFSDPIPVIKKHIELLNRGGYLILEIPNLKGVNFKIQKLLNKDILDKHNVDIMNLNFFKSLEKKFDIEMTYIRYVGKVNFGLFHGNKCLLSIGYFFQIFLNLVYFIFKGIPIKDNKNISPYIVAIYRKK